MPTAAQALAHGAERLAGMKPGQYLCIACGYIGEPGEFTSGDRSLYGSGGHPDHLYCPQCHQSITWRGYYVKQPDGKLRMAA